MSNNASLSVKHFVSKDDKSLIFSLKNSVKTGIEKFFSDKFDPEGNLLSIQELITDQNIHLVISTPFDDPTFDFIHEECLSKLSKPKNYRNTNISWPVYKLLELLGNLKDCNIIKEHQPGMLLLYFKFCLGVEIEKLNSVIPCTET